MRPAVARRRPGPCRSIMLLRMILKRRSPHHGEEGRRWLGAQGRQGHQRQAAGAVAAADVGESEEGRQEVSARDRLADLEAVAETLDAHAERQADVQSWPEWVERSPAEDQVLAAAAQVWELAARLPNFARAKSLLDQGRTVCALDQAGRVLAEFPGTRSEAAAAGWWASYPDTLPAAVCSPEADLFCLDVGHPRGGGVGWLQQACWEPPPAGYVRDEEEFEHRPPGWQLDHLGANVSLVEEVPPRPRLRRVMMSPPMTRSQRDAAYRALRPLSPPARLLLVWTYPEQGRWRLPKPGTHIGSEIRVLAALPAEGVTVVMGGPPANPL